MATFSQSTIDKGSDMVQDFLCLSCEERKLDKTADFYCESCVKFYCGNCINLHSQLFTKHATFGREHMKKWPVAKKVEDFLLKCDVHKEENLKMFCDEHSELCCTNCAFLNHRHCPKVTLISDIVKRQSTDLQQLSVSIQTILEEMKKLQDNQEASIQYVQSSYDDQLHTIQKTRREINAALNTIEQKTLNEMKDTLTKLQASCKDDADKCTRLQGELKQLREAIQDISDKSKLELSFIANRKCKDKIQQSETFLEKNSLQVKVSISFQPNSEILQYLSKLSGLGTIEHSIQTLKVQENPNKVITRQEISQSPRSSLFPESPYPEKTFFPPDVRTAEQKFAKLFAPPSQPRARANHPHQRHNTSSMILETDRGNGPATVMTGPPPHKSANRPESFSTEDLSAPVVSRSAKGKVKCCRTHL